MRKCIICDGEGWVRSTVPSNILFVPEEFVQCGRCKGTGEIPSSIKEEFDDCQREIDEQIKNNKLDV